MMKKIILLSLILSQLQYSVAFAAGESFTVQKDENMSKTGSVYYTSSKKNEVLLKGNIWGAVQYPGVHYMPLGTRMLDALSYAGGPIDRADTDYILLSTKNASGGVDVHELSLKKALANVDYNPVIKPDDILVLKEDRSTEKTQLFLQIGTFLISAAALAIIIDDRK